jgi:hypothetical protein
MTSALGAARSDDISSLREVALVYVGTHSPQGRLEPPIKSKSAKSETRGWKHKGLARYLCPIQYLDAFDKDPEGFGDFFLCFLPVAHTLRLVLSRTSRRARSHLQPTIIQHSCMTKTFTIQKTCKKGCCVIHTQFVYVF